MSQKNETTILVLALLITLGFVGAGLWWFANQTQIFSANKGATNSISPILGGLNDRISLGNKNLITADTNPNKQAGVQAFAKRDFATAIAHLQSSLQGNHNDPEALIYLNNAKANNNRSLKIAVSVPIGGNLNIAKEILRGVAQAQDEVNRSGGIKGAWLQVEIANDDNDLNIAKKLASEFVKDSSILAVVGHNTSDVSYAAAPVYQQGGLVMISPTSDAKILSGVGSYIFRTIPSSRFQADTLSRYAIRTARKSNIAICFDSQSQYSQSFKDEFISAIYSDGGKIAQTNCDFSASNFNPSAIISQAVSNGADGLLLVSPVTKIDRALEVAQTNQGRLALLSSSTLYTFQTLKQGQADVNGMVLAVGWHPNAIAGNPFPSSAKKLWGGDVSWRTAIAYDATQAIITGLRQSNTRQGLQKALSNSNFSAKGATGTIQFLPSGDRNGAAILVKIQPGASSGTGYDFVPVMQ